MNLFRSPLPLKTCDRGNVRKVKDVKKTILRNFKKTHNFTDKKKKWLKNTLTKVSYLIK